MIVLVMPQGTLYDIHFPSMSKLPARVDFTKLDISAGDKRGELDNHSAKSNGNSIGGLVYGDDDDDDVIYIGQGHKYALQY